MSNWAVKTYIMTKNFEVRKTQGEDKVKLGKLYWKIQQKTMGLKYWEGVISDISTNMPGLKFLNSQLSFFNNDLQFIALLASVTVCWTVKSVVFAMIL